MKLSSSTSILKEMKKQESGIAALPERLSAANEDNVIALKLTHWPAVIRREIKKQINEEILKVLCGMCLKSYIRGGTLMYDLWYTFIIHDLHCITETSFLNTQFDDCDLFPCFFAAYQLLIRVDKCNSCHHFLGVHASTPKCISLPDFREHQAF